MGFRSVGMNERVSCTAVGINMRALILASGKSSLAIQFVQGQFIDHYEPTIENIFNKKVAVRGHDYELHLVDTAGQDEFSKMPSEYSVDIHGYVLVYSIDSRKSFDICRTLHEKLVDLLGNDS